MIVRALIGSVMLTCAISAAAAQSVPAGYPADYAQVIAEAKKEGSVTVYATTDAKVAAPLIKDFEALRRIHAAVTNDEEGKRFFKAMAEKNIALLKNSNKDLDLVKGVYGEEMNIEDL